MLPPGWEREHTVCTDCARPPLHHSEDQSVCNSKGVDNNSEDQSVCNSKGVDNKRIIIVKKCKCYVRASGLISFYKQTNEVRVYNVSIYTYILF